METMAAPGKRPFEVSEMEVFLKFSNFCKQLEKVRSILIPKICMSVLS